MIDEQRQILRDTRGANSWAISTASSAPKVVRIALQGAASIAALLITTEAMVAARPEPQGAGGPGGMPDLIGGLAVPDHGQSVIPGHT